MKNESHPIIEASPEVYKLLVESVRDYAIFLLDPDGNVRTWNKGAKRSKLYDAEEIVGQHFSVFYTEKDKQAQLPQRLLKIAYDQGRVENEGWRVRKNGTHFWADVVLTCLWDKSGKHRGFAKVTRDLTERRHLTLARDEALHASNTKSAFLANMSHELRTPLTAIIGYAEMIEEQLEDLEEKDLRDSMGKILFSGRHLMSIISDILDLSKIEAGKLEIQEENVVIADVLKEVAQTVTPLASCNSNTIEVRVADDIPVIIGDHSRIRQILYNLFSNAVKFTRNGKITATASVDWTVAPEMVCIDVRDTGVGMSKLDSALVFDRFQQVESHVPKYNQGGTGLGLAICKMLSEAMDGNISVKSELRVGSTFTVRIPVRR